MSVSEVCRELGELAFHVPALPVPADECPCREPMPHVVEPRAMAVVVPSRRRAKADRARHDHEVVPSAALRNARAGFGHEERR